jgi:methionyl-tRNA formyltransferase
MPGMTAGPLDRLVFFGTPEFALPTLEALVAAGRRPLAVVSQPPRPAGRGRHLEEPPVARRARELGLALLQAERVRDEAFLATLAALRPEVAVVVAFGQIFPLALLQLPVPYGCINLHASLLPRWRGAAPIQAAIAAGDSVTGVTTMRMEAGLDAGPVLLQEEIAIGAEETAGELSARLAARGAALVLRTLDELAAGTLAAVAQREEEVTYAPRLTRESGRADWSLPAAALADRLRAFTPWPGVWSTLRGEAVKLVAARPIDAAAVPRVAAAAGTPVAVAAAPVDAPAAPPVDRRAVPRVDPVATAPVGLFAAPPVDPTAPAPPLNAAPPGTYLGLAGGRLAVACGAGTVLGVEALQRPGRRALPAGAFANGERLRPGERFA